MSPNIAANNSKSRQIELHQNKVLQNAEAKKKMLNHIHWKEMKNMTTVRCLVNMSVNKIQGKICVGEYMKKEA